MRQQRETKMHNWIRGALETPRHIFLLAAFVLAGGALIATPGATADPAFSQTSTVTYSGANSCTVETFIGTGTVHFLESVNESGTGNVHYDLQTTIDGLQAVTPLGKRYVVHDSFSDDFVFSGASEQNFGFTAHFIRVGEDGTFVLGDDFYEYLRTHITANANGMITAFTVNASDMPCQ
jgi:hypothetical protein